MKLKYHISVKRTSGVSTDEPKVTERGLGSFLYSKSDRQKLIAEAKSIANGFNSYDITLRPVNFGSTFEIGLSQSRYWRAKNNPNP